MPLRLRKNIKVEFWNYSYRQQNLQRCFQKFRSNDEDLFKIIPEKKCHKNGLTKGIDEREPTNQPQLKKLQET